MTNRRYPPVTPKPLPSEQDPALRACADLMKRVKALEFENADLRRELATVRADIITLWLRTNLRKINE